jgi:hypothetical protein
MAIFNPMYDDTVAALTLPTNAVPLARYLSSGRPMPPGALSNGQVTQSVDQSAANPTSPLAALAGLSSGSLGSQGVNPNAGQLVYGANPNAGIAASTVTPPPTIAAPSQVPQAQPQQPGSLMSSVSAANNSAMNSLNSSMFPSAASSGLYGNNNNSNNNNQPSALQNLVNLFQNPSQTLGNTFTGQGTLLGQLGIGNAGDNFSGNSDFAFG